MRTTSKALLVVALLAMMPAVASAQFSIKRHVVAGGGGESTGSGFTLRGTVGQNAAGPVAGPMTGSGFSLLGEFWPGQPPPCPSDFDNNGFVNGDDFDAFVDAFLAGDITADFDENGFITGDDYDAYVDAFFAGC